MKSPGRKYLHKLASIVLLLALVLISAASCTGRRTKRDKPAVIISPGEITNILYDLSIADGLLNNPAVRRSYSEKDSVENYMDIIQDHGYTKEIFDENVRYYFLTNPKVLESAYEKVLSRISMLEADLMKEREATARTSTNLWTLNRSISLPDNGLNNRVEFDIPLVGPGLYTLKMQLVLFQDDQSLEPRTTVMFWKDDGTETGFIEKWDSVPHSKSGRTVPVEISNVLTDSTFTHIRGYLLDHSPQPGHWEKHSHVSAITLTRSDPLDSLEIRK